LCAYRGAVRIDGGIPFGAEFTVGGLGGRAELYSAAASVARLTLSLTASLKISL